VRTSQTAKRRSPGPRAPCSNQAAAEAGGGTGDDGEPGGGGRATVTEAQRLRAMVDAISSLTSVQPKGCCVANALNQLVGNKLFSGLDHPDKLEDFQHRWAGVAGAERHGRG
jgi:hypothetical protein